MRKTLLAVLALVFVMSVSASANLLFNGDFQNAEDPAAAWMMNGEVNVHPDGDMSVPYHTGNWAGVINSWGGNWNGPVGSAQQTIYDLTAGSYNLSFDYYMGARYSDAGRVAGIKVKVNGAEVFNESQASANLWSGDFFWKNAVVPVVIAGDSAEVTVEYTVHYAEWTWLATDNFSLTQAVPEPGSMLALISGLAGFGGMIIRRRK